MAAKPLPTPVRPSDALADLEASFENQGEPADLLVIEQPPPPIGRSWAFDFSQGRFVARSGTSVASGPLETHGDTTLIMWCEKAMRTARGSHPIHPPGYGMRKPYGVIGMNQAGASVAEIESQVRDTLTFHPRIADISDFAWTSSPDDEFVTITFEIVRDDESRIPVQTTLPLNPTQTVEAI